MPRPRKDHPIPHHEVFNYCRECAAPLEVRDLTPIERRPVCTGCGRIEYIDPKLAAAVVVSDGEGIVLVRRAIEPGYGKWAVPGGFVDRGEEVPRAAMREVMEEIGVEVELTGLLGIYSYEGWTSVVTMYEGEIRSGTPRALEETLEVHSYHPAELPWDDIVFYSTHDALRDYLRRHHPEAVPPGPPPSASNPRRRPDGA